MIKFPFCSHLNAYIFVYYILKKNMFRRIQRLRQINGDKKTITLS